MSSRAEKSSPIKQQPINNSSRKYGLTHQYKSSYGLSSFERCILPNFVELKFLYFVSLLMFAFRYNFTGDHQMSKRSLVAGFIIIVLVGAGVFGYYFIFHSTTKPTFTVITINTPKKSIKCVLGIPPGKGPFPAVIVIHGGAGGNWPYTYKIGTSPEVKRIVDQGFVVLTVDYGPHGVLFRGVVGGIELVGDDIADTLAAYCWLINQSFVNVNKIITLGSSHGGFVSLVMGFLSDVNLAGIIEAYGPTNLTEGALYLGCSITPDNESLLRYWSPVTWVQNYTAPILIIHGNQDELIPINQSYEFIDLLDYYGKEYYFYEYNQTHGFLWKNNPDAKDAWDKIIDFLNYIKTK